MKEDLKRNLLIGFGITVLVASLFAYGAYTASQEDAFEKPDTSSTPKSGGSTGEVKQIRRIPLTEEQNDIVTEIIESSEFVDDLPDDAPVSLQFFYFEDGERVLQDTYLIGKGGIINSGKPLIRLTLHARYIPEFETRDLCSVIQQANKNRDLGFSSSLSNTKLLWVYKGTLKHRDCLGL